jgi:mono/diheme cytochrome c family protein
MSRGHRPDYLVGLAAVLMALGCAWTARRQVALDSEAASAVARRGQQVFSQHCVSCHSDGVPGLRSGLGDTPLPAAMIALQIRQGRGTMPAFSPDVLSDQALTDLVAYLDAQRSGPL